MHMEEKAARLKLEKLLFYEESVLKQRSRNTHIYLGDGNTRYFYGLMKKWHSQAFISQITDSKRYYILWSSCNCSGFCLSFSAIIMSSFWSQLRKIFLLPNPFGRLNVEDVAKLLQPVSIEEIEYTLKIANPHEAQDPNGFNARFFKFCWPIIGKEVSSAIMEFFWAWSLLNQLKATFIVLVPIGDNILKL